MGFFKDVAFETSKKWEIARYYYGDDIAKELYYLPNTEPLSLMTEKEKAALKVIKLIGKAETLDDRYLVKTSDTNKQKRRNAYSEAKEALGPDFIPVKGTNSIFPSRREKAVQMWQRRLELFKATGSVEE